ncbi:unnamed protein product, partial [Adineta steineri]
QKNRFQQFGIIVAGGNGEGQKLNQLSYPEAIFIDNDKSIYIADKWNHRIVKWKQNSDTGEIIAGGNESGNRNNQLNRRVIRYFDQNEANQQVLISNINCEGLTIDKNGFIYASDCWNHEVRRWKEGDVKGELVAGGSRQGNRLNQLNEPTFIFIDEDYSLYISDADCLNNRVMRWCEGNGKGEIAVGGNGIGSQPNQLISPTGLLYDNEGNLYIVDQGNYRIQKYEKILN